ncbi:MAG: FAD-dependent oxidoreductase [Planctomycetota bacterium]
MSNSPLPWPESPPAGGPLPGVPTSLQCDVGIVGAGIHGAALARELTLRGVSSALIDIGGVGGGTSQWSTQLLHGGLRYLRTGDFRQVREGLAERATWMRIAPHRCTWRAFHVPMRGWWSALVQRIGITLYDTWGRDRPDWPRELRLGRVPGEMFAADPRSHGGTFRSAVAYADLQTDDRALTRDLAASSDTTLLDFHEVLDWQRDSGRVIGVRLRDRRDESTERGVTAAQWVLALGPWTDRALARWFGPQPHPRLRLSAGIHLWLDAVPGCDAPWTVMRHGGRVIFVIPRDGMLQIATTEREVDDGCVAITQAERDYLYAALADDMPAIAWRELKVHAEESGVRPLVLAHGRRGTAGLSREARLDPLPPFDNVHLVLGGKLTTARRLMDQLATKLTGERCPASRTTALTPHA